MGDWACIWTDDAQEKAYFTDFGAALLGAERSVALWHIYGVEDGYEAMLGDTRWAVTEHSMEGISLSCIEQPEHEYSGYPDPFLCHEDELPTADMQYVGDLKSSDMGAHVPESGILRGRIEMKGEFAREVPMLLAYLPPAGERNEQSGLSPCWYGGYVNMDAEMTGMFLLGENSLGRRFFAQVFRDENGREYLFPCEDGLNMGGGKYGARDMQANDVTRLSLIDAATGAYWPTFWRGKLSGDHKTEADVSYLHKPYYALDYIPRLRREIAALEARPAGIWTQNGIALRQGLIQCAMMMAGTGPADEKVDIERVLMEYRGKIDASLAGIHPGDTLAEAKKLYPLRPITQAEAEGMGFYWVDGQQDNYWDGSGLVVTAWPDGRIDRVSVYKPGYATPDGRQVGGAFDMNARYLDCRDAKLSIGEPTFDYPDGQKLGISRISMQFVLDRVWDETQLDVDGDGIKERLTLSGRCYGAYVEQGTVLGDSDKGRVEASDYGTKAKLSIYKGDTLYAEAELPLYIYFLLPRFCDKLQTKTPGEIYILCETGGTGNEEPVYCVTVDGKEFHTEFVGFRDIYSR